ncbi:MAG: hypothetical protein ABIK44_05505 [candidate division WOR-3 bacterium]
MVAFQADGRTPVALTAYDVRGNAIAFRHITSRPGWNELVWNCTDFRSRRVATGIYILRLEVSGRPTTRKVVIF